MSLFLLTIVLIVASGFVAYPLLPALTWAAAFAVIVWPLHARLASFINRPSLSALFVVVVLGAIVVGAGAFMAYQVAAHAAAAADGEASSDGSVRETVTRVPGGEQAVGWLDRAGVDLDKQARELATHATSGAAAVARGSAAAIFQLLVALILLFHLLKDRDQFVLGIRRMLPMSREETDRVFESTTDAIYGGLFANLMTSVVAAVSGGLVFWAVGLPAPVLLAAAIFVLDLVPAAGVWMVWAPAAAYLASQGQWGGAVAVVVYGAAVAVLVDNVLFARLAGDKAGMHPAIALVAVVGGLAAFGAAGLVLGPVILAVAAALLEVWHERQNSTASNIQ